MQVIRSARAKTEVEPMVCERPTPHLDPVALRQRVLFAHYTLEAHPRCSRYLMRGRNPSRSFTALQRIS